MDSGFISVWSLNTWREVLRVPGHGEAKMAFSPTKPILAVGFNDTSLLYFWSLDQAKLLGAYFIPEPLAIVSLSVDGRFLYVLSRDGKVAVANLRNDDLTPTLRPGYQPPADEEILNIAKLATTFGNGKLFYNLSESASGTRAVAHADGIVNVFDPRDGHQLFWIPLRDSGPHFEETDVISKVCNVASRIHQQQLGNPNGVELWDLEKSRAIQEFKMPGVSLANAELWGQR